MALILFSGLINGTLGKLWKILSSLLGAIPDYSSDQEDFYTWTLEKCGSFSAKSFYKFLIDGGMRSPLYSQFWKTRCLSKISLFCWLAWEDKLLTLTNLFKKNVILKMPQIHAFFVIEPQISWTTYSLIMISQNKLGPSYKFLKFTHFLIPPLRFGLLGLLPFTLRIEFFGTSFKEP